MLCKKLHSGVRSISVAVFTVVMTIAFAPTTASAQRLIVAPGAGSLVIPEFPRLQAVSASEIGPFESDFCAEAESVKESRPVKAAKILCFGHVRFREAVSARALVLKFEDDSRETYVELDPAPVELRVLRFKVIGPVNKINGSDTTSPSSVLTEMGEARITIDERGEAAAVALRTPRHGIVVGTRVAN